MKKVINKTQLKESHHEAKVTAESVLQQPSNEQALKELDFKTREIRERLSGLVNYQFDDFFRDREEIKEEAKELYESTGWLDDYVFASDEGEVSESTLENLLETERNVENLKRDSYRYVYGQLEDLSREIKEIKELFKEKRALESARKIAA